MDGLQLADVLAKKGFTVKSKSKTSIILLVDGDRIKKMLELAEMLSDMDAKVDRNIKGSSIGGVVVGTVKILIKSAGKSGGLDVEAAAIFDLEEAVIEAIILTGGPINIKLKGRVVKNIVGVEKTAGTPKSDFHLTDVNGKAVIHISHKTLPRFPTPSSFG